MFACLVFVDEEIEGPSSRSLYHHFGLHFCILSVLFFCTIRSDTVVVSPRSRSRRRVFRLAAAEAAVFTPNVQRQAGSSPMVAAATPDGVSPGGSSSPPTRALDFSSAVVEGVAPAGAGAGAMQDRKPAAATTTTDIAAGVQRLGEGYGEASSCGSADSAKTSVVDQSDWVPCSEAAAAVLEGKRAGVPSPDICTPAGQRAVVRLHLLSALLQLYCDIERSGRYISTLAMYL